MTAPIEWRSGRLCDFIIGKPNSSMMNLLQENEKIECNRFLVIGDTFESDIVMVNCFGAKSILISKDNYSNTQTISCIGEIPQIFCSI